MDFAEGVVLQTSMASKVNVVDLVSVAFCERRINTVAMET